jgi:hypothetical protein
LAAKLKFWPALHPGNRHKAVANKTLVLMAQR